MEMRELLKMHRFDEVIQIARQQLARNPGNWAAVSALASAYRATEQYEAALPLFERLGAHEQQDEVAMGHPGRQKDVSCLYWCMNDKLKAISIMRSLVDGVLNGSIQFGDAAGGIEQGLLLYYMGVTAVDGAARSFALEYLRNRVKRPAIRNWPGPVARYHLGDVGFSELLADATKGRARDISEAVDIAKTDLLALRRLCVALFHDAVKARAEGDEAHCEKRMKACCELKDPLIEPEWYLARCEVEHRATGLRC